MEVTPIWVDVYEKNYNKSLDHRSFYFKQTDKKALSAKGMTGEIKEMSDKKKSSEDAIGCGANGATGAHGVSPDLTFTYADRRVHDDVYAVLKFSTHEMMSAEHADRVMKTWRDFVEPFFGIARGDPEGDYVDDSAENAAVFVRKNDEEENLAERGEDGEEGGARHGGGARDGSSDADANADAKVRGQTGAGDENGNGAKRGVLGGGEAGADADMTDADGKAARTHDEDIAGDNKGDDDDDDDELGSKKRKGAGGQGGQGVNKKVKKEKDDSGGEEDEEGENATAKADDDAEDCVYAACKPLSGMAAPVPVVEEEVGGKHGTLSQNPKP